MRVIQEEDVCKNLPICVTRVHCSMAAEYYGRSTLFNIYPNTNGKITPENGA